MGRIVTGAVFLFLGAIYVAYGIRLAISPPDTSVTAAFSVASGLSSILLNFGFFLMHYERLLHQREDELGRTESTNRKLADLKNNLQDAVNRKTAELIQTQRMDSIGRLAAGVAHDFNNLLTVIGGSAALLLRGLPGASPLRRYGDQITSACEKAQTLTQQLLTFGRTDGPSCEAVELNSVLREIELILREMIGPRIELAEVLSPAPVWARIDRGEMHQVIMNLVVNARDAMPGGGRIVVGLASADAVPAGAGTPPSGEAGPFAVLSVDDTGIGIDVETQSRIFEPFFTTKGPGKGTGLGLSTVYGLITNRGGCIRVESNPGQGTVFRIYLPRAEPNPQPVAPARPTTGVHIASEAILVVEDESQVRSLVCEILRTAGYTVMEASNGVEGIAVFEKNRTSVQLVLTDVVMPDMGGPALVLQLRSANPNLKVLFMSAYPDTARVQSLTEHCDIQWLRKPFTDKELTTRLREVFDAL